MWDDEKSFKVIIKLFLTELSEFKVIASFWKRKEFPSSSTLSLYSLMSKDVNMFLSNAISFHFALEYYESSLHHLYGTSKWSQP